MGKLSAVGFNLTANGWGLTKFKKYQMKKIEKTFFKFCLSPCYVSVKIFLFIFCAGAIIQSFFSSIEKYFQKDLVCIVIVFTFALQF